MAPIALLLVLGLVPAAHAKSDGMAASTPRAAPGQSLPAGVARSASRPGAQPDTPARRTASRPVAATDDEAPAPRKPGATTVYQAVLPDGTLFVGDRPPETAQSVRTLSYPFPQGERVEARAEARRQYWREQAEAFNARQREREQQEAQRRQIREVGRSISMATPDIHYLPRAVGGTVVVPPSVLVPVRPSYTSTPGAVRGRDAGFIGSGFQRGW